MLTPPLLTKTHYSTLELQGLTAGARSVDFPSLEFYSGLITISFCEFLCVTLTNVLLLSAVLGGAISTSFLLFHNSKDILLIYLGSVKSN